MQVSVESTGNLARRVTLSLPAGDVDDQVGGRLRELARRAGRRVPDDQQRPSGIGGRIGGHERRLRAVSSERLRVEYRRRLRSSVDRAAAS